VIGNWRLSGSEPAASFDPTLEEDGFEFLESVYCGLCKEEYLVRLRDGTVRCDACGAIDGKPKP
jgi:hypothetical protein